MDTRLSMKIVLQSPPPGFDFGLQKGSGSHYETVQIQRSTAEDLSFEFEVRVKSRPDGAPNFLGPFTQGPADNRFVYIDIGASAGQKDTWCNRRLKIPLYTISWNLINQVVAEQKGFLQTEVPGTGKDGTANCGTVKPFAGWSIRT